MNYATNCWLYAISIVLNIVAMVLLSGGNIDVGLMWWALGIIVWVAARITDGDVSCNKKKEMPDGN